MPPVPSLFRYREDRLPVVLILLLFALDLVVFATASAWYVAVGWAVLTAGPKVCVAAWNHHHQHVPMLRGTLANRLLEVVFALQTGIVTNTWVLHHNLGHHENYLDQEKDESAWRKADGRAMGPVEYTATVALTGYSRAWRNSTGHKHHRGGFVVGGIATGCALAVLLAANWLNAVIVFILPMVYSYVMTCRHTYDHHAGLSEDDPYAASYNITHRWYNILTGNLGYHTAHHLRHGLHWSKLPDFHAKIAAKIPAENFVLPNAPVKWLPAT